MGNSIKKFDEFEDLVVIETPITISSQAASIKYFNSEILSYELKSEDGDLSLGLLTTENNLKEIEI